MPPRRKTNIDKSKYMTTGQIAKKLAYPFSESITPKVVKIGDRHMSSDGAPLRIHVTPPEYDATVPAYHPEVVEAIRQIRKTQKKLGDKKLHSFASVAKDLKISVTTLTRRLTELRLDTPRNVLVLDRSILNKDNQRYITATGVKVLKALHKKGLLLKKRGRRPAQPL